MIIFLPFVMLIAGFIVDSRDYLYPEFVPLALVLGIACLLPSVLLWILPKIKLKDRKFMKAVCVCLCVAAIPLSFICGKEIYSDYSRTEDISHYRYLDTYCMETRSGTFNELFRQFQYYNQMKYYYYYHYDYGWNYTDDIYAEWVLSQREFDEEVARVRAMHDGLVWKEVKMGDFVCLFDCSINPIFEEVTAPYNYYIFAYDKNTRRVKYIHCYSAGENGDTPYYL